jgi:toxin ParE1/3/4
MAKVHQPARARLDISEIWLHIAEDSIANADQFIDRMSEVFQKLADFPHMGRRRDELEEGVRSFPFGEYIIFYRLAPDGIAPVRVIHGARKLDDAFDN